MMIDLQNLQSIVALTLCFVSIAACSTSDDQADDAGADTIVETECDDTCDLAQAPLTGEITITEGFVGYSLYESDVVSPQCGAPCEVYAIDLQVAAVDAELDLDGLSTLVADPATEWTAHTVEGAYEVAMTGPVAMCWQYPRGPWPNLDYRVVCTSFTIEPGEVWTVHPFGWFSDVGRIVVFDPNGDPWPSETFHPSFEE